MDQKGRNRHGVARHVEGRRQGVEEDLEEVHDDERRRHGEHEEPRVPQELPDDPPCDEQRPAHYPTSSFSISERTTASSVSVSTSMAVTSCRRPYGRSAAARSSG